MQLSWMQLSWLMWCRAASPQAKARRARELSGAARVCLTWQTAAPEARAGGETSMCCSCHSSHVFPTSSMTTAECGELCMQAKHQLSSLTQLSESVGPPAFTFRASSSLLFVCIWHSNRWCTLSCLQCLQMHTARRASAV